MTIFRRDEIYRVRSRFIGYMLVYQISLNKLSNGRDKSHPYEI